MSPMTIQLLDSDKICEILLQRAEAFSKKLPQSQGARREGKAVVLTFIQDKKLPADKNQYRKKIIDKYAKQAYKKIFAGDHEIDLLLMDARLIFSTLFWDGQELSEMEFTYFMNDLLFLAGTD